jgi:hypothetical protein
MKKKPDLRFLEKLPPKAKKEFIELLKKSKKLNKARVNEQQLKVMYDELFDTMSYLILLSGEPQMVASTMMAQALRLYKTVLKNNSDFEEAITVILRNAYQTEPFTYNTLH